VRTRYPPPSADAVCPVTRRPAGSTLFPYTTLFRSSVRRSGFMRILVAVKQVPDTATQVKVSADPRVIDTTGITWIISPYDEFAVEEALRIKEKRGQGEVVAVSLGPERVKEALRACLAMGCDRAIHLNEPAWSDADTLVTAKAL